MTSTYDLYPSDFTSGDNLISCSHATSKLSILSNYAKHSKGQVHLLYALPPFIILKSLYPTNQPAHLER